MKHQDRMKRRAVVAAVIITVIGYGTLIWIGYGTLIWMYLS